MNAVRLRASRFIPGLLVLLTLSLPGFEVARAQTIRTDVYVANGTVNAIASSGNTIYIGGSFTQVGPATGGAVPIDSVSGQPVWLPRVAGIVSAMASDGAGGWYLGGAFTHVAGLPRSNLAHILSDHTVAPWNPGTNAGVFALAVGGSVVYAGGLFTSTGGQSRNYLAALDAATGIATAWNPNPNADVIALAVSGAKVFAGGNFTSIGGQSRNHIASLDTAGIGLATAPWSAGASGRVRALLSSGAVLYAGGDAGYLAAIDPATGSPIPTWVASTNGLVNALTESGDTLYVGGLFTTIKGQSRRNLAAIDISTGFVPSWNPSPDGEVRALAASGSTVYAGGLFTTAGGQLRNHIAAFSTSGIGTATTWNPNSNLSVYALAADRGVICAGGNLSSLGGQARSGLAAIDAVTGVATAWNPGVSGAGRAVSTLAVSGGTVYVGGSFTTVGGLPRSNLASVDAAGAGAVTPWNPNSNGRVFALAAGGPVVYAGGAFTSVGGELRSHIAALDAESGIATAWDPGLSDDVHVLLLDGDRVYVGGDFGGYLAALDTAGMGEAMSWNPRCNQSVTSLAVNGDVVYAGGGFTSIGGQARNHVGAVSAVTGLATAWNPNSVHDVDGIVIDGGAVYAGGSFSQMGGVTRWRLAAMDTVSGSVLPWDPSADYYVNTMAKAGHLICVGGDFHSVAGMPQSFFAAFVSPAELDVAHADLTVDFGLRLAPNPAARVVQLEYTLPRAARVRISLFDVQGRLVARPVDQELRTAGRHVARSDVSRAEPGVLLARIEVEGRSVTRRIAIVH